MTKINKELLDAAKIIEPIVKAVVNIPTMGLGGAIIEICKVPYQEIRRKNIDKFMKETIKKFNQLKLQVSENEFKKRINSEEFYQIFIKIINKIQLESRIKIRRAYSNLLVNLVKEDIKIRFNQKLFYSDVLDSLNEDHLKILNIFYAGGSVKDRFSLDSIHKKMDCYEKRKIRAGDPVPIEHFFGGKEKNMVIALNYIKSSYIEGLISELASKQLIKIDQKVLNVTEYKKNKKKEEIASINSEIQVEYEGTELGNEFYKSIKKYK